jgi:dihydroorotate dehydrogenase
MRTSWQRGVASSGAGERRLAYDKRVARGAQRAHPGTGLSGAVAAGAWWLAAPVLSRLDPETAHDWTLRMAALGGATLARLVRGAPVPDLARTVAGLTVRNPLGIAAGLDKNGVALPFWRGLGFGFFEFGTVTPRAQPGNPPPRIWRYPELGALVNRLGFPNEGAEAVARRLRAVKQPGDVVGINLGRNADTPNERAAADYVAALELTRDVADYWVVNVSSPHTPGLRALQAREPLTALLGAVRHAARATPLFVKLAPDLSPGELAAAAAAIRDAGCAGVIATNTTVERSPGVATDGGVSGRPLRARARQTLVELRALLGRGMPIIAVGGIDGPDEARARLRAGADLLQVYTALVLAGPSLVSRILEGLRRA